MKIFLHFFALLALISASTTELRQRSKPAAITAETRNEPTVESLVTDDEFVEEVPATAAPTSIAPTAQTDKDKAFRKLLKSLTTSLGYLQLTLGSMQYRMFVDRIASSQLLFIQDSSSSRVCGCPAHSTEIVYYYSLFLALLSSAIAVVAPRWGSVSQGLSLGLIIPQLVVMFAWTFGMFSMETGLEFYSFLQMAPKIIAYTPSMLFIAFIIGKLCDNANN